MSDPVKNLISELRRPGAAPIFVTGAGISVASGIATFRGDDPDAIWKKDVLEMGTFSFFCKDPVTQWQWYLQRFDAARHAKPNPAHHALAEIERERPRSFIVTQNIDGLHLDAGSKNVIEVHGAARRLRCSNDDCVVGGPAGTMPWNEGLFKGFRQDPNYTTLPKCVHCESLVRPHVLWFDESYVDHIDYGIDKLTEISFDATCAVFIGTSFSVTITMLIIEAAEEAGWPMFNIDPKPTINYAGIQNIPEAAEVLLPRVAATL